MADIFFLSTHAKTKAFDLYELHYKFVTDKD